MYHSSAGSSLILLLLGAILGAPSLSGQTPQLPNEEFAAQASCGFRQNVGQWDHHLLYRSRSPGGEVAFLREGLSFAFLRKGNRVADIPRLDDPLLHATNDECLVLNRCFVGIRSDAQIIGQGKSTISARYILDGNPRSIEAPDYPELWYHGLYVAIDLRYYIDTGRVRYDYIVHPGGDPDAIQMCYDGADRVAVNRFGDLEIITPWGTLLERAPVAYQDIDGVRRMVAVGFRCIGRRSFGFAVTGEYDPSRPLVIDPVILEWSTFVGGPQGYGTLLSIARDRLGNVYGTGIYYRSFPTTPGVHRGAAIGNDDGYIFKLSRDGKTLLAATYIGGHEYDGGLDVEVDSSGYIYLTGATGSRDFPVTPGAYQQVYDTTGENLFLLKLDPGMRTLLYSTLIGAENRNRVHALTLGPDGGMVITGQTNASNFPTTPDAFSRVSYGDWEGFVTWLAPAGDHLRYSSYIGGSKADGAEDVRVNSRGEIFLSGCTNSLDFPITPGAYQQKFGGGEQDGFALRFTADGTGLIYCSYYGGTDFETANQIEINDRDEATVVGITSSTNFPTGPIAFDFDYNGETDIFAGRFSAQGTTLDFSTYLGGTGADSPGDMVLDALGNIYLVGVSHSADFPVTSCAMQSTISRTDSLGNDLVVVCLDVGGASLHYATYFGGPSYEGNPRIELGDPCQQEVIVAGVTDNFPTTPGSFQPNNPNPFRTDSTGNSQPVVALLRVKRELDITWERSECTTVAFKGRAEASCFWIDPASPVSTWRWDFGDGTTSNEENPTHHYARSGGYRVVLATSCPYDSVVQTVLLDGSRAPLRLHLEDTTISAPGDMLVMPVRVDNDLATIDPTRITFVVRYDTTLLRSIDTFGSASDLLAGTLLEGWIVESILHTPGRILITVAPPPGGGVVARHGTGLLLNLHFATFIRFGEGASTDSVQRSRVACDISAAGNNCDASEGDSAEVRLNICGLRYRLIEMTGESYILDGVRPNPFNPSTEINFSLGLDGPTRLEILDLHGSVVAILVDEVLTSGWHTHRWDAGDCASGLYYCRLVSGDRTMLCRMILAK